MVREVVAALEANPGGTYVDCTVSEGGHSLAILEAAPGARLLGIDLDATALETAASRLIDRSGRITLVQGNYAEVAAIAAGHGLGGVDGVLFDLGLSSLQVDTGQRGFSFREEAPLDMRFDPGQTTTAHQVVNGYTEHDLAEIISRLGEEPRARRVARAIVRSRPIETTTELGRLVARATGRPLGGRTHPATRTFQAIRMTVNRELDNLRVGLEGAIQVLGTAGRLVAISYHSLEDRLVKSTLRREASECICPPGLPQCICGHTATVSLVGRKPVRPSQDRGPSQPPEQKRPHARGATNLTGHSRQRHRGWRRG